MQASQSIAIDLPLRFLVCENEAGVTLLSFYSAEYLARRHGIEPDAAVNMTLQIRTNSSGRKRTWCRAELTWVISISASLFAAKPIAPGSAATASVLQDRVVLAVKLQ
jgi:hypothetical protein